MSEPRFQYIIPNVPVYAYFWKTTEKGMDEVFCIPVVAYACWYEDGCNDQEPLIVGDIGLERCDEAGNFLCCQNRENLPVSVFRKDIEWRKKSKGG
jgi:hypothetical protein